MSAASIADSMPLTVNGTSNVAIVADPVLEKSAPYYGNTVNPFFGQDHAYSVTFRGNGQAVVFLKVALANNGDLPLRELSLRLPNVDTEGFLAYQIIRESQCTRYDYKKPPTPPDYKYPCLEYGEPNYSDYYYGNSTYKKAKVEVKGDALIVQLPQELASQKSGAFLLYYRAMGYAKKNIFGAYTYNFETLKVDDTIRSLRVGISPDADLYMKGARGTVDYFRNSAPALESGRYLSTGASFKNTNLDTAINNMGYGTINKNASNLMPLDSYKVNGSYADSRLKLYAGPIAGIVAVVLIAVLAIAFVTWRIFKSLRTKASHTVVGPSRIGLNIAVSAFVGFISASIVTTLFFLAFFFVKMMSSGYSGYYGSDAFSILPIFGLLVFIGFVAMTLLLPCILVGVKRGVWWGLATFVFTIFWLFVVFTILFLIFFLMRGSSFPNFLM